MYVNLKLWLIDMNVAVNEAKAHKNAVLQRGAGNYLLRPKYPSDRSSQAFHRRKAPLLRHPFGFEFPFLTILSVFMETDNFAGLSCQFGILSLSNYPFYMVAR